MTPRKLIQYTIYSVYSEKVLLLIWKRFLFRSKNFSKKKKTNRYEEVHMD